MKTISNAQKTENRKLNLGILALTLILANATANGQPGKFSEQQAKNSQIAFITTSRFPSGERVRITTEKPGTRPEEGAERASFRIEAENTLQIEAWMLDNKYFRSGKAIFGVDDEKPLTIEHWMTDNRFWKKQQ